MSDERSGGDLSDEQLERVLMQLGPIASRQEWAESQGPTPQFGDTLRSRLVKKRGLGRRRNYFAWAAFPVGAAAVAALALLALNLRTNTTTTKTPTVAFAVPTPQPADVSKSYPLFGGIGGGGPPSPTQSLLEETFGQPYFGRLTLTGSPNAQSVGSMTAYVLQPPPTALAPYVAGLAKKLGIPGQAVTKYGTQFVLGRPHTSRFAVVAQGNSRIEPLHSIAVSAFDGEMIYHDTTMMFHKGRGGPAPARAAAIATSRAWLTRLGWPGASMNVLSVAPVGGANTPSGEERKVELLWPGVSDADRAAATLLIDAHGKVAEALVWPVVGQSGSIKAVGVNRAWQIVQTRGAPIGVKILTGNPRQPGHGKLIAVSREYIVTTAGPRQIYLIPAYRFSGTVTITGTKGQHPWFSLVPVTRR